MVQVIRLLISSFTDFLMTFNSFDEESILLIIHMPWFF